MALVNSKLWDRYKKELTMQLRKADPTITDQEIEDQLDKIARTATVPITTHDTTHDHIPDTKQTLYQTIDQLEESDDIISAAGVIVSQHKENLSPFVNMIVRWKKERKSVKTLMFKAIDAGDNDKARYYNKLQMNLKSNKMNALYGILALITSAFFHEFVPNAVTSSGRQLIAHSAMLFESVLGDNCRFLSMSECIDWIQKVCDHHANDVVDNFVMKPTVEMTYERMVSSFSDWQGDEDNFLHKYIDNLTTEQRVYVYYCNNMVHFIDTHPTVKKLIKDIYAAIPTDLTFMAPDEKLWVKYNGKGEMNASAWRKLIGKHLFLDPYSPPANIEEPLKKLGEFIWKYCYTPFLPMCIVARLNKQTRKAVAVIDTDSNMIYTEKFMALAEGIHENMDTGIRGKRLNNIIGMMIVANIVDPIVVSGINTYFGNRRVSSEYFPHMVMKNEWYYSRMLISLVKKRYAGNGMIQEGLILPKSKYDIKGFDFKKAAIPKPIQTMLIDILINRILTADEVLPSEILSDLNKVETMIRDSILAGNTEYWKMSTYKSKSAYKNPERIQVWKGGELWNQLHPEDKLESLDKACIAKLKNKAVIDGVECDNVIAVPMKIKQVPQNIIDQLDIDLMVYNIISSFNSVLDCFNIQTESQKTSSGVKIQKRVGVVNL
jgi:hypothetical protein